MEILDWNILPFKKQRGKEKLRCPNCDSQRSDKKDKSLSINHNDGYGKCHYCDALVFKEDVKEKTEKEYKLPRQDWKNYTELSDNMVKYLEKRKISQSTAIELGLTEEKYYQPSKQKEVTNLVFNFFEGNTLVNKKYRSGDKKFTQSAGSKSIFYNINSILGKDECYIVEGEMDVLAMYETGFKNVISVPNGANDNDDYWINSENYIKGIEKFVIAVDNDEKGNDLKEKIAQRLGRYRCTYIEWNGKDANDDLISGKIQESVKGKKRFPVSGTLTMGEVQDDVYDLYENGLPDTISPKSRAFGNLNKIFSVMRGQLTTVTGIPSHGKSNFNDWYVLNMVKDHGLKASWFSPEHSPISLYNVNFIEKISGVNFWGKSNGLPVARISKEEIAKSIDWANEKLYFTIADKDNFPTWDWIFDKFKEQMYTFGVDIFIVDAFNKVLLPKGNKLDAITEVLTKLTAFAQANNVMVFLVAHPTKMQKKEDGSYSMPTLYDVSGSADFRNMTHNGYTVYRNFDESCTDIVNMKTKFGFQGKMGEKEVFEFDMENGRYYVGQKDSMPFYASEKELPKIEVEEAFEKESEIPF